MEFLSLRQLEGMSEIEYQLRFLMLERFALDSFASERECNIPIFFRSSGKLKCYVKNS